MGRPEREPDDDGPVLHDRYLAAQLAGDRREALRLIIENGLGGGMSAPEVQAVIRAAQRELGRLWQEDRITIAQEHMATAISHLVMGHLYLHAAPPTANGKRVLVACVEGEQHDLPARFVADALDLAGFDVRYLGASVPIEGLLRMIDEQRPDLLVLSVTMTFNLAALRTAVARVRVHTGGALPIAIGGGACEWSERLAAEIGADLTGRDASELIDGARRLLRVEP